MKKVLGIIAVVIVVVVVLGVLGGGSQPIETCEDLAPRIIELSKEKRGPFNPQILKLYDIKKNDTQNTNRPIDCIATAKTDRSDDVVVSFYLEEDADGDRFIGYNTK